MDSYKASELPPKLEAVLARLCERLGPVTKTKAVKLPYLVDVLAEKLLGARITEGSHETWEHGVVTREVYRLISHDSVGSGFVVEPFKHRGRDGSSVQLGTARYDVLGDGEILIVDEVANEFGSMNAEELGKLTKSMNTDLDLDAWGANLEAATGDDAYARLASGWKHIYQRLENVDLANRKQWGEPIDDSREYLRRALGPS